VICDNVPEFEVAMKEPHILVSISQAYSQLIQDWSEKKWFNEISILTKEEEKIIALLRDKSTKDLQIKKKDGEPDRLIKTTDSHVETIEDFANKIVRNGYQDITVKFRKGKPVHFENKISIKLKDVLEAPDN